MSDESRQRENSSNPFELDIESLRHPDSVKWMHYAEDVLPLWVADMDFAIAPSIAKALTERLTRTVGYHHLGGDPRLKNLLRAKMEAQGLTDLPADGWIHFVTGVVPALYASVAGLTEPGDEVITMIPIYPPFLSAITDHGRVATHVRLIEPAKDSDEPWRIDFEALSAAVTPKTRLLMLCHPHNPTGRLWTRAELAQIADFAAANDLYVVTDELHADLTLDGQFIPFASVASPAVQQKTVTLIGPCKTYNTAGLGIGAMISHNPDLIKRITKSVRGLAGHAGVMNVTMWRAALLDDGQWLSTILDELRDRRQMLTDFIAERLPSVRCVPPQATYLAWLDYRAHPRAADIQDFLLKEAKVGLNNGPAFGPGYEGFVRLNFATSREILRMALERLAAVEPGTSVLR